MKQAKGLLHKTMTMCADDTSFDSNFYILSRCDLSRRKIRGMFMQWKYSVKLTCLKKSRWIATLSSGATVCDLSDFGR